MHELGITEQVVRYVAGHAASDTERIRSNGCRVDHVNPGSGCHQEADMLAHGLEQLDPPMNSVVMIENVGNLVCPALSDLGERAKINVSSVTEGEDKPDMHGF